MFLFKHQNGRYYVYYNLPNGKRKTKSTGEKTKREALGYLNKFREEIKNKALQKFTPITIKEFQFHYFRYIESLFTVKTCKSIKTTFNFLIRYFDNIQLSEITSQKLEDYFYSRIKRTSIYSARSDYAYLSSAFNKAIRDGFLLVNPCRGIKRFRVPEKQPLFYSKEDLTKLLYCIDNEDIKELTIFAFNTGLRQGELIALEWRQINFQDRLLTLDNQTHITKSKKIRSIPLNRAAFEILDKRFKNKKPGIENIFTIRDEIIKQDYLCHAFKKYVHRSGINQRLNFHSLRHTFASFVSSKGSFYLHSFKVIGAF